MYLDATRREATATGRFLAGAGEMTRLFLHTVYWFKSAPRNIRRILDQMVFVGVESLPITSVMALFVGMVLALGVSGQLVRFRIVDIMGAIVGMSLIQELGPAQTAFLIAGRVGAAIAAEIGTMAVSEEIDALKMMSINPVRYLAMPRLVACMLMVPVLTVFTDIVGLFGGCIIADTYAGVPPDVFFDSAWDVLTFELIWKSLVKSMCFGSIVATVGCYMGFTTYGGAEGVGRSTTRSVVVSFMLILVANFFLTRFLYR